MSNSRYMDEKVEVHKQKNSAKFTQWEQNRIWLPFWSLCSSECTTSPQSNIASRTPWVSNFELSHLFGACAGKQTRLSWCASRWLVGEKHTFLRNYSLIVHEARPADNPQRQQRGTYLGTAVVQVATEVLTNDIVFNARDFDHLGWFCSLHEIMRVEYDR